VAILRLLGGGASGSILLALGDGPLRTKDLTRQVPGFTPRTVYRYVSRLTEIGVLEREEEAGVPSKVIHSLADPCGTDLRDLVEAYCRASVSLQRLPDGGIVPHSWRSLTLLADLWESGMFEKLNLGPCTATELAGMAHGFFSFHQVNRRINLFMIGDLIQESETEGRRRHYELTPKARNATALIIALGQWRERHAVATGESGLTVTETAELVRATLPLVALPEHEGKSFELGVVSPKMSEDGENEVLWAEVGPGGAVTLCTQPAGIDGWGRGAVGAWIKALSGTRSKVRTGGGNRQLVKDCLEGMHEALWKPAEPLVALGGREAGEVSEVGAGSFD